MKLWNKEYTLNKQVEDFTVGNDYILDQKLVKYDCQASKAHVNMLSKIGILTDDEAKKINDELNKIIELDKQHKFIISKSHEDCHTAIENFIIERLGDLGKKIHTARSRNDQVLTALRLYYKDGLTKCRNLINEFDAAIAEFADQYGEIEFPGYTHTRKAMPSSIRLWAQAFSDSLEDNKKLLITTLAIIDQSPLGTGAGYGVPIKIDRNITAHELGFTRIQDNPIYTQLSRGKFESTILHTFSQIMFDLNRIATDLILFSMPIFGYFILPREFCTGSSIMPQKKNPDVLEILRAKYHQIISFEFEIKSMMSNLISGYHRDVQLTKGPMLKSFKIVQESLSVITSIFKNLKVDKENCQKALTEELYATQEAYKLVEQGVPFREAYQIVAKKFS